MRLHVYTFTYMDREAERTRDCTAVRVFGTCLAAREAMSSAIDQDIDEGILDEFGVEWFGGVDDPSFGAYSRDGRFLYKIDFIQTEEL